MASGKRASMREGPLAALFRQTEEPQRGQEESTQGRGAAGGRAPQRRAAPCPGGRDAQAPGARAASRVAARRARARHPEPEPAREQRRPATSRYEGVPTPEERLRSVFSTDIPENIMERAPEVRRAPAPEQEPIHRPRRR